MNILMKNSSTAQATYIYSLLLWGIIYLLLAVISLKLDDPVNRVAMVWFPAGVTVSASLSLPRHYWPALYIMLFSLRTVLDLTMRHTLETSLVISLISLFSDCMVAVAVQYFGRNRDDFRRVCTWLISTITVSALAGATGALWLSTRHPILFINTATLWWAANVSGNIVATTVLTGLTWEPGRRAAKDIIKSFIGVAVVAIIATLVFSLPSGKEANAGIIYGLACLPILFTIVVPICAGTQAGALAFLALSIVAIFFSRKMTGPFFIEGLRIGEPLLLAQVYLSGTAVLTIFVRLLLRFPKYHREECPEHSDSAETAFRLNIRTGHLDWDPHGNGILISIVRLLTDRETLLCYIDEETREQFFYRWKQVVIGLPIEKEFFFRIALPDGDVITVREHGLFFLPDKEADFLVGFWSLGGPAPVISSEKH